MDEIARLYNRLKEEGLLRKIGFEEPLKHLITVDKCRRYWKPPNVKTMLLAESHVLIDEENYSQEKDFTRFGVGDDYPKNRVNFVYCLGQESGKVQFWKILSASVGDFDFSKLLKSRNKRDDRIRHKIEILGKMRRKGIWLVDASIFALYPKKNTARTRREVIVECWESYVGPIIEEENPERILVIGKEVWNSLRDRIPRNMQKDWIYQPQAQLKGGYRPQLEKCYKFCRGY